MNTSRNLALALASTAVVVSMAAPASAQGVTNCIIKGDKACEPPPNDAALAYPNMRRLTSGAVHEKVRLTNAKCGQRVGTNR